MDKKRLIKSGFNIHHPSGWAVDYDLFLLHWLDYNVYSRFQRNRLPVDWKCEFASMNCSQATEFPALGQLCLSFSIIGIGVFLIERKWGYKKESKRFSPIVNATRPMVALVMFGGPSFLVAMLTMVWIAWIIICADTLDMITERTITAIGSSRLRPEKDHKKPTLIFMKN